MGRRRWKAHTWGSEGTPGTQQRGTGVGRQRGYTKLRLFSIPSTIQSTQARACGAQGSGCAHAMPGLGSQPPVSTQGGAWQDLGVRRLGAYWQEQGAARLLGSSVPRCLCPCPLHSLGRGRGCYAARAIGQAGAQPAILSLLLAALDSSPWPQCTDQVGVKHPGTACAPGRYCTTEAWALGFLPLMRQKAQRCTDQCWPVCQQLCTDLLLFCRFAGDCLDPAANAVGDTPPPRAGSTPGPATRNLWA